MVAARRGRLQEALEDLGAFVDPVAPSAFIFGVVPLVIAEGAGAEMRRSPGTAVFGGMLGVTLFGIFLTPVFYYVIQRHGTPAKPAIPHESNGAA